MSTVTPSKNTHAATEELWRIAETDDTQSVESILAAGADINASNAHGMTALMHAASLGHIRMVEVLLKHGANPNMSRNDKFTPLMLAAFFGHEEVVKVLVAHGADPGAATRSGASAQIWAAARTFQDVAHYLDNPQDSPASSKASAALHSRLQAQVSMNSDGNEDSTTPAMTVDSAVEDEWRIVLVEPSTLAGAVTPPIQTPIQIPIQIPVQPPVQTPVQTPIETAGVKTALQSLALRSSFISRLEELAEMPPLSGWRIVYSLTTVLLAMAMIAGLTLREQRLNEVSSKSHPTVAVNGGVAPTSAVKDSDEGKTTAPSDAQVKTLALGNDVSNLYKKPENVTEENRSKQPLVIRSIASPSETRRGKLSEEQNVAVTVNQPTPIPADKPEDVRIRELPSVAASTTKSQPAVSRVTALRNGPASSTTDLISPSLSTPPKGRTIQWP